MVYNVLLVSNDLEFQGTLSRLPQIGEDISVWDGKDENFKAPLKVSGIDHFLLGNFFRIFLEMDMLWDEIETMLDGYTKSFVELGFKDLSEVECSTEFCFETAAEDWPVTRIVKR
jgi:hypothetical protein